MDFMQTSGTMTLVLGAAATSQHNEILDMSLALTRVLPRARHIHRHRRTFMWAVVAKTPFAAE
jgi:hypothetical protein